MSAVQICLGPTVTIGRGRQGLPKVFYFVFYAVLLQQLLYCIARRDNEMIAFLKAQLQHTNCVVCLRTHRRKTKLEAARQTKRGKIHFDKTVIVVIIT